MKLFNFSDPRTTNLPLVGSLAPFVIICAVYLRFVLKDGPNYMKDRKPFELKGLMAFYNLFQVIVCFGLASYGLYWWILHHKFKCQPVEYSNSPLGRAEITIGYCYFLLKITDFMDTIFIVLRKKSSQISFLHLYHHIVIASFTYLGIRFAPGGHPLLLVIVNSFVHSIMYFYYFLNSINPEVKKSIWWKKYITQVQLIQFLILLVHFGWPLIFEQNCNYPKSLLFCGVTQNLFMVVLFSDFYRRAYLTKKTIKEINK